MSRVDSSPAAHFCYVLHVPGGPLPVLRLGAAIEPWVPDACGVISQTTYYFRQFTCRYPAAHYLDCGSALLMNGAAPKARLISRELVPDGRQPVTFNRKFINIVSWVLVFAAQRS